MKKSLAHLLACCALAAAGTAQAATTWYLKDATFSRGAGEAVDQATGWFIYDEATNTYTDWNISVTNLNGVGSSFTFDYASLSNKIAWGGADSGSFRGEVTGAAVVVALSFAESLATASGDVALKTDSGVSRVFRQYSLLSPLVSGSVTTSPVPEVETGVAFALGLLGLAAARRRHMAGKAARSAC